MTTYPLASNLRPPRVCRGLIVPFLAATLLAACGANVIGEESEPEPEPAKYEMAVGESLTMDTGRLRLTFEGVPFDNRCPRDVQCIVAGMARVALRAQIEGGEEHEVTLELGARGPREAEFEGYTLRLLAVDPYPVSTKNIEPEDYRIRLVWEREK